MSQPSLASPGTPAPVQKQSYNIYTMMLVISFICIVVSCVLLYMELKRWGNQPWWRTQEAEPRAAWLQDDVPPARSISSELAISTELA